MRLVAPYVATRTFQANVLGNHDTGTTGVNDRYAIEYFEGTGAEIVELRVYEGAGHFLAHERPQDVAADILALVMRASHA